MSRSAYAAQMGALFAPFTKVAAANPHAAAPVERTAAELVTPTERNRPITDPYTRFLVARDQVNQGAAVLLLPAGTARDLGVPPEACVYLHGHADLTERDVLDRADLGASPAAALAIRHALEQAGISLAGLDLLDLYSCFPIAVLAVCDGLGLDPADPRGLTLTGGLPFFGGPGNNYSMHAIAEMVTGLRARPGAFGLVGANGGILSKYSAAVFSTAPAPWRPSENAALQEQVAAWPPVPQATAADGPAVIESWTVAYPRSGPRWAWWPAASPTATPASWPGPTPPTRTWPPCSPKATRPATGSPPAAPTASTTSRWPAPSSPERACRRARPQGQILGGLRISGCGPPDQR